jgi:hypothetical protein
MASLLMNGRWRHSFIPVIQILLLYIILLSSAVHADGEWWDTDWKYRKQILFDENFGRQRSLQWVNLHVIFDPLCANKTYNTSLRMTLNGTKVPLYSVYNVTYCPKPGYVREANIEFRFNTSSYSNTTYYLYYTDNSSIPADWDTSQEPIKIIWGDYGSGYGPNKNAYRTAINSSGYAGMYDEYSLSSGNVPVNELKNHSVIIWAQAGRTSYLAQTDFNRLYDRLTESANVFLEGSDIGSESGGWQTAQCVKQLLHVQGSSRKGGNDIEKVYRAHPVNKYIGPVGTTFSLTSPSDERWNKVWGSFVVEAYRWGNGRLSSTVNNGTEDTGCPGSPCGKTGYISGSFLDTGGYGIQDSNVRKNFMKGMLEWFFEPTIDITIGPQENYTILPEIINPHFNASTVQPGGIVRFNVTVYDASGQVDSVTALFRYPNGTEAWMECLPQGVSYYFDWSQTSAQGVYRVIRINVNDSYGTVLQNNYTNLSFTVSLGISINVTIDLMDFGSGAPTAGVGSIIASNETNSGGWASNIGGFIIQNIGTQNVKVLVYADKTASEYIGGTSPAYKFSSYNPSIRPGCNSLQYSWTGMSQNPGNAENLCDDLGYIDSGDQVGVSIQLYIPADAPVKSNSQSTLTFIASSV